MILMKADTRLKTVFTRLIKTIGEHVEWNGVFAVAAGNLILPGKVRSMFFQIDQKKLRSHVTEFPSDFRETEEMEGNDVVANVLNMILYAYGKWGIISGLKVEKDYGQLNKLFSDILKIIEVEVKFDEEQLHFFHKDHRISYEEVLRKALDFAKFDASAGDDEEESALGLWHNVKWRKDVLTFQKIKGAELTSRLGHNFYCVDYACPDCGEPLHMIVFPVDKELLVDTEEGAVYLARAYTCAQCLCFYTPRPGKLIREGDCYYLHFDEDQKAYEDYLDLLGMKGDRCSNYKFNEFAVERGKEKEKTLSKACEKLADMSEKEVEHLMDQVADGFYTPEEAARHEGEMKRALRLKQKMAAMRDFSNSNRKEKKEKGKERSKENKKIGEKKTQTKSSGNENLGAEINEELSKQSAHAEQTKNKNRQKVFTSQRSTQKANSLSDETQGGNGQYKTSKIVESETEKPDTKGKSNIDQKREQIGKISSLKEAAEACQGKTYLQITAILNVVKQMEGEEEEKDRILFAVSKYKRQQAQKEAGNIIARLPEKIAKKEYEECLEKLKGYDADDVKLFRKQLDEKRDISEKHEIDGVIKQSKKKSREELLALYEQLKQGEFCPHNVEPYLEKIHKKIYEMDQEAIDKICPDMLSTSFEDVAEAYEMVAAGLFLPELKENTLAILDKRLTKIKVDENTQLVRKLKKEMERVLSAADQKRVHFYEARSVLAGEVKAEDAAYCKKAMEYIGGTMSKYEFPVIICDSSYFMNGKEGYLLTPDRMCYKNLFKSESFSILGIQEMKDTGKLFKLMEIKLTEGRRKKLPGVVRSDRRQLFIKSFSNFVSYLQEKPDSRKVSYLVRDKHAVKCCFRCGFHYKGEGACPKCGYRENK